MFQIFSYSLVQTDKTCICSHTPYRDYWPRSKASLPAPNFFSFSFSFTVLPICIHICTSVLFLNFFPTNWQRLLKLISQCPLRESLVRSFSFASSQYSHVIPIHNSLRDHPPVPQAVAPHSSVLSSASLHAALGRATALAHLSRSLKDYTGQAHALCTNLMWSVFTFGENLFGTIKLCKWEKRTLLIL